MIGRSAVIVNEDNPPLTPGTPVQSLLPGLCKEAKTAFERALQCDPAPAERAFLVSGQSEAWVMALLIAPPTLGTDVTATKYAACMAVQRYVVSSSGQLSLPADVRRRWDLVDGGPVDVIDLGFGVLTIPHGEGPALLADLLSREQHADFVDALDDIDLATT